MVNKNSIDDCVWKIQKILMEKYGCTSVYEIPGVKEKRETTNIEKYGSKYPFQNKDIYEKFEKTMLERYGAKRVIDVPELV